MPKRSATVCERFIGFIVLEELDAKSLAEKIVHETENLGLNMQNCVAQCYDGASVMSGKFKGVQARTKEIVGEQCTYIHC